MTELDLYSFDDLLIACAKEVVTHGIDTDAIPKTIKDWLAGKILETLPKKLIQRLLAYIIDHRESHDLISYKENSTGEEFTLMLYKSIAQKNRLENYHNRPKGSFKQRCEQN